MYEVESLLTSIIYQNFCPQNTSHELCVYCMLKSLMLSGEQKSYFFKMDNIFHLVKSTYNLRIDLQFLIRCSECIMPNFLLEKSRAMQSKENRFFSAIKINFHLFLCLPIRMRLLSPSNRNLLSEMYSGIVISWR